MKKLSLVLIFVLLGQILLAGIWQQTITTESKGMETRYDFREDVKIPIPDASVTNRDARAELVWQTTDPSAIAGEVAVSSTTMNSLVSWYLNAERLSLYNDTPAPVWEHTVGDLDFGYPIDQLEDGSLLVAGDGPTIKIFDPSSSNPTWQHTIAYSIGDLKFSPAGDKVYISFYDSAQDRGMVECYNVGDTNPVWSVGFEGGSQTLDISGDGTTLIFTQYGGGNSNMWVLNSVDGSVIFQGPEYNQNPPAICYDASVIVNGDYSGYVHVYQYNDTLQTYEEVWNFHVDGGGTSDWIGGMAISADGTTIAVGTLTFVTGGYNGQIYMFNTYSPTPLWVYDNAGDYVIDLDLTDDGSVLAAASYGPMDNTTADFFLFRKESNVPVFEINTPGSLFSVDMSGDGTICTTGGKAVHARVMGSGGVLYNLDSDLGGGFITGVINLEGCDDNSGAKAEVLGLTDYYAFSDYDGNFSINNVPLGSYTVEYYKVGYIANSSNDVVVTEGGTTDLGVINMMAFGSPPLELAATQASDIFVELNWQVPATGTVEGYNIYRKKYEFDPYPEDPNASVGPDDICYMDNEALPGIEYYYVVTAALAGGLQSPYSNEVQGWISTGFVVDEISVYEGTTPTIDGMITAGEWDDAFMLDTSDFWGSYDNTIQPIGSVIGYFKTNAAMTELYVAYINYNDTILEDHDEVALYIDDNNDGVFSPEVEANEGNYWAAYYAAGNELKFRPIYDTGGVGTVFYLPNPQLEVSVDEGYLVYEFMIPIGTEPWEINPSADNQSSLAVFVLDDNTPDPSGFDGWWPLDNINLFAPDGFGTITYGAAAQTPPAPQNFDYIDNGDNTLTFAWDQININDFDHYNLYLSLDGTNYDLIGATVGINYTYELSNFQDMHHFYVTAVNQQNMESDPSNIIDYQPVSSGDTPILQTKLNGNYPNPFNPITTISFSTTENSKLTEISIYNLKGQKVKTLINENLPAGEHTIVWNGKDDNGKQTASGIYFYKMKNGNYTHTRKMLLLK